MTVYAASGNLLATAAFQTANLAPPTPWDESPDPLAYARRLAEIQRTQREADLLWQAHTLERQQQAAARIAELPVAQEVVLPQLHRSVA